MKQHTTALDIKVYPPDAQGVGQFDGGRITEIKPIGFPQDGPVSPHLGPLFYWAWATAKGYGKIGLHPHQAFEIMSYALEGEIGHSDTLGTKSRVKAGGAQVMQTGSGVSHEEETIGDHNEFFQIWFEPHLQEAVTRPPTYREFADADFPVEEKNGVRIKSILGAGAPVTLVAEVAMQDVVIQPGHRYQRELAAGRTLAMMIISGKGVLLDEATQGKHYLEPRYFAIVHAGESATVSLQTEGDQALRTAIIEVPATVDYPLVRNGR